MTPLEDLSDDALLSATRSLVQRSLSMTADLLLYLGEVDARQLYLGRAYPSMFAFCMGELGFSEETAYKHIGVARLARRLPEVLEFLRAGRVHLAGIRLLVPHLTHENHVALLEEASGKPKRYVEEMVARLAPRPPVPESHPEVPRAGAARRGESAAETVEEVRVVVGASGHGLPHVETSVGDASVHEVPHSETDVGDTSVRPVLHRETPARETSSALPQAVLAPSPSHPLRNVIPLAEETFKVQFTASRALRNKLREAQDLAGYDSDLASLVDRALDLLLVDMKKKRFAAGCTPRSIATPVFTASRHIPSAIKRAVYARDQGSCTFADDAGKRCAETRSLEYDHVEGFARTHHHSVDGIRLRCKAHNHYAANQLYGRGFMDLKRSRPTGPGSSCRPVGLDSSRGDNRPPPSHRPAPG